MSEATKPRRAFRRDAAAALAGASAKAAFWTAAGSAVRRIARTDRPVELKLDAPPPPKGFLRRAWLEAFEKDRRDVAAGLYPLAERLPTNPVALWNRARDLLADAREVNRRRAEGAGTEAREHPGAEAYPAYYRQNFHFQSGGWFTEESARRYEAQVEALFAGATGPMRRRALSLLAKAWRDRDQRGLRIVDVACGSGAFLVDLKAAFPRARIAGLDLSPAYLQEAEARSGAETVQGNAEALPFADGSLDAVTCIYLFHELPPRVRSKVAAELARVLKPGGVLAFADSIQKDIAPELARPLAAFPAFFHEPYFESYQETDLVALFGAAGLTLKARDEAFLTQALLFEKA